MSSQFDFDFASWYIPTLEVDSSINENVPEPATEKCRAEWTVARAKARMIIDRSLSDPKVQGRLAYNGWNIRERNPKVLHDIVLETFYHLPPCQIEDMFTQAARESNNPERYMTEIIDILAFLRAKPIPNFLPAFFTAVFHNDPIFVGHVLSALKQRSRSGYIKLRNAVYNGSLDFNELRSLIEQEIEEGMEAGQRFDAEHETADAPESRFG
ncbi:hypothetical protein B0H63DRAFT_560313 [Podospora didyma]|uniref:Uncharacterized protein n=1 Tax=Podospora didyma TaxID=330526 RepID=A0AAE0TZV9_9PEZI|nr:hypothetical protein B0H63DRAFT_560313 [Podospora didyma]